MIGSDSRAQTAPEGTGAAPPSVFLSAGEPSGDWAGALLVRALAQRRPDLTFRGIGGPRMADAGVELLADSSAWGVIGVFDALPKVPRVWRAVRAARAHLARTPPSAAVLIDAGAVNIRLARQTKAFGVPTLYYLPPGSWRRRLSGSELPDLVDAIATPFPWSRDLLSGGRARVEWVGHPVVDAAAERLPADEARRRLRLDPDRPVVALAPGSREQEMRYVLPVLAEAARLLAKDGDGAPQYLVPAASHACRERIGAAFGRVGVEPILLDGMDYSALQLADAAAVCSGTATLEFACLGVPMVVVYRASAGTTAQYVVLRGVLGRQRWAAMPNIIANREVVRELLRSYARPEAVARELRALLHDEARREEVRAGLAEVAAQLGEAGASGRTAEMVLELMATRERIHGAR